MATISPNGRNAAYKSASVTDKSKPPLKIRSKTVKGKLTDEHGNYI